MKTYRKYSIGFSFFLGLSLITGCTYMNSAEAEGAVARVGENYLLEDEVNNSLGNGLTAEDSAIVSANYINEWAKDQLLFERARINISEEKQQEFEQLVSKYRADLYINAYKEALVNQSMDTVVGPGELEEYYENNKQNFRLNEDLLRLRYISLPKDFTGLEEIREAFRRFEEEDVNRLRETALKFKFYSLNDSSWVRTAEVVKKIPMITPENKDQYLKKSQFFELSDSLGVYLVTVKEVLKRTETPPLDYVEPAIKKILLNKRKLEYIRKLEQELLEEATRDNEFELLK
ncbi:peptidyl-prolyl cis-trans isomerase [Robertkochia marina]|uniref:Peptidyl-prolyl cis-trans isomerase n=1 Tax=Robertkochia marina TaxID=1227945 RepID=A0A4S3LXC2_9FLAO|nr:peptidyl-prolyl cis-trans isomerase [Robertkochia marina]THD65846.1 peptidyl-prolyl cis-trans isomerase [Robertkochia marina]